MFWRDTWRFNNSIEYEFKYPGRYGAKGEKRAKRKKATPDQIKRQNQTNRENYVRRLIKANFSEGDMWCCLKYPKGIRKEVGSVRDDLKDFLQKMRREYKKQKVPFKYIYRMEVGERGGIHIHILFNRLENTATDLIAQKCWQQGRVNYQSIYDAGGYKELADYIVKQPKNKDMKQLSLFPEEERKELIKYSSSRNLIRPEPERKMYSRKTMRDLIENGPKPTPGFYIDKSSIVCGVNLYTGHSYYRYTEVKIDNKDGPWMEGGYD